MVEGGGLVGEDGGFWDAYDWGVESVSWWMRSEERRDAPVVEDGRGVRVWTESGRSWSEECQVIPCCCSQVWNGVMRIVGTWQNAVGRREAGQRSL